MWILLAAVLLVRPSWVLAQTSPNPNIIVIMLEEIGKENVGFFYQKIFETPNIDELAALGVRFSKFYVNQSCVSTRASFLTGLYPPRTGFTSGAVVKPPIKDCLDPGFGTFVQDLRAAGYATAAAGKWHICYFYDIFDHPD